MYCPNCGAQLPNTAIMCYSCRFKFNNINNHQNNNQTSNSTNNQQIQKNKYTPQQALQSQQPRQYFYYNQNLSEPNNNVDNNRKNSNVKMILALIVCFVLFLGILGILANVSSNNSGGTSYSSSHSSSNKGSEDYGYCSICGGKTKCAICGKEGRYCENASYGSGNDHYCQKHWADCVEWHEGH